MTIPPWVADAIRTYPRIVIAGPPHAGKTTLANLIQDRPVLHTDSLMHLPWADVPPAVNAWAQKSGDRWAIEGVQVPRVLRKGLEPDAVIWLGAPMTALSPGQLTMAKGIVTVFDEWSATSTIPILTRPIP